MSSPFDPHDRSPWDDDAVWHRVPESARQRSPAGWGDRQARDWDLHSTDDADEDDGADDRDGADDEREPAARRETGLDAPVRRHRWDWAFAAAVLLAAAGIATATPVLVVAGLVPLAAVAYAGLGTLPTVELEASRSVSIDPTAPGEPVEVELVVRNAGEHRLPDVRVVDLVPDATPVLSGAPRAALDLAPGESATVRYTLGARRGRHAFDGVRVEVRNAAGSAAALETLAAAGDDALTCELPVEDVPLADETTARAGAVSADEGGEGVEFHAVRDYRPGDRPADVDWRRYARTGELTTVRYREQRAAEVVLVVDARDPAYVSDAPDLPAAAELSAYAAERAYDALASSYHDVGFAALYPGSVRYVEPSSDPASRAEVRELLEGVRSRSPLTATSSPRRAAVGAASSALEALERDLPGRAQVVLFTPATDAFPERLGRGLLAHGYPITVVAPALATGDDPAQRVVAVERERRLLDLRGAGARVVEWERERPLPLVLERAVAWGGGR